MCTIFIGNCAGITKAEVEDEFKDFGNILHIAVHKSYAFVEYDSKSACEEAIRGKHKSMFNNRPLTVQLSEGKPGSKKSEGGSGGGGQNSRSGPMSGGGFRDPPRSMHRGFSPPRNDMTLEARLREVADRERIMELERQIVLKEQRAKEILLAQEIEKRKLELERSNALFTASSLLATPQPQLPQQHLVSQHAMASSDMMISSSRQRHPSPNRYHDHDDSGPSAAKQRRSAAATTMMGENMDVDLYRNMVDCCIIYVEKQLRSYAENVHSILLSGGMVAELQFISRDESLAGTLDHLSQKGIISAVILDELNEQRKTANVHFLHGCPRGEVQTGITEIIHWIRMQQEYNKYLVVSGKQTQSLRELLAELCGEGERGVGEAGDSGHHPHNRNGMNLSGMNSAPSSGMSSNDMRSSFKKEAYSVPY